MIILAQCLAMFPVSGVEKKDYRNLCFKWRSFKVYLSLIVICLLLINCGFQVFSICVSDSSFGSFGECIKLRTENVGSRLWHMSFELFVLITYF